LQLCHALSAEDTFIEESIRKHFLTGNPEGKISLMSSRILLNSVPGVSISIGPLPISLYSIFGSSLTPLTTLKEHRSCLKSSFIFAIEPILSESREMRLTGLLFDAKKWATFETLAGL